MEYKRDRQKCKTASGSLENILKQLNRSSNEIHNTD